MSANKKYKQGEIYLVRFHPTMGKELRKYRPAVIVFDSVNPDLVTITPLTSIIKIKHPIHEFIIKPSEQNGLEHPSLLLSWYLRTMDHQAIQKHIGTLNSSNLAKLKTSLTKLIS